MSGHGDARKPTVHHPACRPQYCCPCRPRRRYRRLTTIARWVEVSATLSKHFARLWNGDVSVRQIVSDLATEVKPLLEPRIQ